MKADKLQADIYRSLVDSTSDVVILTNEADEILSFNADEVRQVFGYKPLEVSGRTIRLLLPGLEPGSRDEHIEQIAAGPSVAPRFGPTVSGRRKNGGRVPLEISITEGRTPDGARAFTWVLRDVTERLRLNAELREIVERANGAAEVERELLWQLRASNLELKVTNENLQKFTSIVAHDLRAPLGRIEAFVEVLQTDFRPALDEEGADILDRIAKGAARMRRMLESLQQYSRYNSVAIAGKTAKLEDVVRDALSAFDIQALGVEVRVAVGGVDDARGDPILLSHVLQNLIGNAVKFRAGPAPVIAIDCRQIDQEIRVSVTDNGIGIEPKFADKIFNMFYRLHDDDQYEGTGVGLTVSRKIVNDHGGRIWLDTDHQPGTRFVFTLQVATEADRQAPAKPPRPKYAVGKAR